MMAAVLWHLWLGDSVWPSSNYFHSSRYDFNYNYWSFFDCWSLVKSWNWNYWAYIFQDKYLTHNSDILRFNLVQNIEKLKNHGRTTSICHQIFCRRWHCTKQPENIKPNRLSLCQNMITHTGWTYLAKVTQQPRREVGRGKAKIAASGLGCRRR